MSDSTSHIRHIAAQGGAPDAIINANFDSLSPALVGGRAPDSSALTFRVYGGRLLLAGDWAAYPDATLIEVLTLMDDSDNYVWMESEGTIATGVGAWGGTDVLPLYKVVTADGAVSSITDYRDLRALERYFEDAVTIAMGDANKTLTLAQSFARTVTLTGSLTATRDVTVPAVRRTWTVYANTTTNGVRVTCGGAGTVTIAAGKFAIVHCDGTDVLRVTADA